jgi:uncharacterized protein DUF4258
MSRKRGNERSIPDDPLAFIRERVREGRILWTYHVNMRMRDRFISRENLIQTTGNYEIIEAYPDDKYLPSFLVHAEHASGPFHVLFGVDVQNENVRVITAYRPDPNEWSEDLRRRKAP